MAIRSPSESGKYNQEMGERHVLNEKGNPEEGPERGSKLYICVI